MLHVARICARRLLVAGVGASVLALVAAPAEASNKSIFKATQTYVTKSEPLQAAFGQKYTAGDWAGARAEALLVDRNAVVASAVLKMRAASNARGAKGKRLLLRYWVVKRRSASELRLAAEARAFGNTAGAEGHIARYDKVANAALGLLAAAIPYVT